MGISLVLEILPGKITKEEWEGVYLETLKLINAYPFGMLDKTNINGEEIIIFDKALEQTGENTHWRISGDYRSMQRAETFKLYKNLENYGSCSGEKLKDILKYHLDGICGTKVFSSKTQGLPYHKYILAISCLIEYRLEGAAILYGDFDKGQALKAIGWANSILETPIGLPIKVDYQRLYDKLKQIKEDLILEDLYYLAEGKEIHKFIEENFIEEEIFSFYTKEMLNYKDPTQVGHVDIMIDFLNTGYPLEKLCDMACLHDDGPMFNQDDFIRALCSTWVLIPEENRMAMDIFTIPEGKPDTVYSLFGKMYLKMGGMSGMNIKRYIAKDEFTSILRSKFRNLDNLDTIIEKEYKKILKTLEQMMDYRNKLKKEFKEKKEMNAISDIEYLIYWDEDMNITEDIIESIKYVKEIVMEMKEVAATMHEELARVSDDSSVHYKDLRTIARASKDFNLILSRKSWDWIVNAENNSIYKTIMFMIVFLCKTGEKNMHDLAKALLENKELFLKYMI